MQVGDDGLLSCASAHGPHVRCGEFFVRYGRLFHLPAGWD